MANTNFAFTRASLTIRSPSTTSVINTGLNVTKASLQPSPKTILTPRNVAVTKASLQPAPKAIGLTWEHGASNLTITVNAATISPVPYPVFGRRGIPVLTAYPTFSPKVVNLAYRRVFIEQAVPAIAGKPLTLEENHFFVRGKPAIAGQSVGLRRGTPVISAAFTLSPKTITLTLGGSPVYTIVAATPTIAGQGIGLNLNFSLAPAASSFSAVGKNINLQWSTPSSTNVAEAHPVLGPQTIGLARAIRFTSAVPTIAGKTIAFKYDWGLPVEQIDQDGGLNISGRDIGLSFTRTLEATIVAALPIFAGKNITLFLGNGAPRRHRVKHKSPGIEIMLKPPITTSRQSKANVR